MYMVSQSTSCTGVTGSTHIINITQAYMGARMGRRQVVVLGLLGSFVEVGGGGGDWGGGGMEVGWV